MSTLSYEVDMEDLSIEVYNYKLFSGNGKILFALAKNNTDTLEIAGCSFVKEEPDVGAIVEFEVVANGYIMRRGDKTMVTTSNHEYKNIIDELANKHITTLIPFDEEDWPELDIPNLLIAMNARYKKYKQRA